MIKGILIFVANSIKVLAGSSQKGISIRNLNKFETVNEKVCSTIGTTQVRN
jgi:hypothetical protein